MLVCVMNAMCGIIEDAFRQTHTHTPRSIQANVKLVDGVQLQVDCIRTLSTHHEMVFQVKFICGNLLCNAHN